MNKPTAEELKLLLREHELKLKSAAQDNFLNFVRIMWPDFVKGPHHQKTAIQAPRSSRREDKTFDCKHATKTHQIRICIIFISCLHDGYKS